MDLVRLFPPPGNFSFPTYSTGALGDTPLLGHRGVSCGLFHLRPMSWLSRCSSLRSGGSRLWEVLPGPPLLARVAWRQTGRKCEMWQLRTLSFEQNSRCWAVGPSLHSGCEHLRWWDLPLAEPLGKKKLKDYIPQRERQRETDRRRQRKREREALLGKHTSSISPGKQMIRRVLTALPKLWATCKMKIMSLCIPRLAETVIIHQKLAKCPS